VLFTVGVTLLTVVLMASAPTLRLLGRDITETLKESARTGTAAGSSRKAHRALIIAEIAVALIVIVGMSLLIRSFDRLVAVPTGFDGKGVLTLRFSLPAANYDTSAISRTESAPHGILDQTHDREPWNGCRRCCSRSNPGIPRL
jgi:putative ABC transport system permease protein